MEKNAIGIFDSGVGGLTVFTKIKSEFPNENIVYLGDTKNFPYGGRKSEEIIEYSIRNVDELIKRGAKMIIIACGTATSQAIDVLKEKFEIPIIGIIEPTVKYIKEQKIKRVGVIATKGTIRNGAWEKKLKEAMPEIEVINKACPMLAEIAEEGRANSIEGRKIIKEYMEIFKKNKIDKIILGCTHYPIYEKIIREEFEYDIELIHTGETVAKYIKKYMEENRLENKGKKTREEIYLTKPEKEFANIAKNIMKIDTKIQEIRLKC